LSWRVAILPFVEQQVSVITIIDPHPFEIIDDPW
jgi:hypothetical protein